MSKATKIEWCTTTWNPVTGCSKVSEGCRHCYAEALSLRFGRSQKPWTHPFAMENVVLHPERLDHPFRWRDQRIVFVNSMSDLYHELVPFEFIDRVFDVMAATPRHTFQVLTKRPKQMLAWFGWRNQISESGTGERYEAPGNVWLGVSVEDMRAARWRIPELMAVPSRVRFLSCEPLLGPLNLRIWLDPQTARCRQCAGEPLAADCTCACHSRGGVNWVIVGGESGPRHRPMDGDWAQDVRDQCNDAGVPFFFKQWGGLHSKAGGRELDGRIWDEMPSLVAQPESASIQGDNMDRANDPRTLSLFGDA